VFLGPEKGLSGGLGSSGRVWASGALYGPYLHAEPWRLVTSMFLHASLFHLGFNMWALWAFGAGLEQRWGHARYLAVYVIAGLWGGAGVILVSPTSPTVGASGAIFGLMGAIIVVLRRHGRRDLGGMGPVILINLVFTFTVPGISIGGHVGGLIGGIVAATMFEQAGALRARTGALVWVGAVALAAAAVAVALAAAPAAA
jgi:membrane associated rhomboid family serine protease